MSHFKISLSLFLTLSTLPFSYVSADDLQNSFTQESQEPTSWLTTQQEEAAPQPFPLNKEPALTTTPASSHEEIAKALEIPFSAFTGKVKGKKVRLRLRPDLDSQVVKELGKSDLITVIGEKGDFWAVEPPSNVKAYVFRRFVIDNEVEGNRVNVRLEPSLESPIIGHLSAGEKVSGNISALNNKWLEIAPPSHTQFYIAKEFVENVGGPDFKIKQEKRKDAVIELINNASLVSKEELSKPFEDIDMERVNKSFSAIIEKYSDFPAYIEQAKEALITTQEAYLQKKLAFLETRKEMDIAAAESSAQANQQAEKSASIMAQITDKMKLWEPVEEALYLSWAHINDDRAMPDFYEQQKANPIILTGMVEPYTAPVKNKPGDFIIKDKDLPVGYLYSTQVNLQEFVGKKVTAIVSQRPNNNFAFPAYYVLAVE